jgi:hypothetical protein
MRIIFLVAIWIGSGLCTIGLRSAYDPRPVTLQESVVFVAGGPVFLSIALLLTAAHHSDYCVANCKGAK